jgi:hypothetical protein
MKGKNHLEDLGTEWRLMLKWILEEKDGREQTRVLAQLRDNRQVPVNMVMNTQVL